MVAAIQGLPPVALVSANDEAATPGPVPRLLAFEGRRALILAPEPAARFAFAISGEPVAPIRVTVYGEAALAGLNLLANADLAEAALPWRLDAADEPGTRLDRDIAEQWTLEGGHTAYIAGTGPITAHHVGPDGSDRIPAAGGRRYRFGGLFGLHRCEALLRLEALRADGTVIGCAEETIGKRLGGRRPEDYAPAEVALTLPREAAFVRLAFAMQPARAQPAHLFFTALHFGLAGRGDHVRLGAARCAAVVAAVANGAALLDVLLPPLRQAGDRLDVFDASGHALAGAPATLTEAGRLGFALHAFEGASLSGALTDIDGPTELTLLVDGRIAATAQAVPDETGRADVALRLPDAWLDGRPHVVRLEEAASGTTLFHSAEILRAVLAPAATLDGTGRAAFAADEQGLARERYRGLAAHLAALAGGEKLLAPQAARCHAILAGHALPGEGGPLALPQPKAPAVTVAVHGPLDAATLQRCAAGLIFAGGAFETILLGPAPEGLETLVTGYRTLPAVAAANLYARLAAAARGRHVAFLDAACEPLPGWLDALSAAFTTFPGIGAAGPKILDGDGRLAEAGRVVWSSGRIEPLAYGGNPRDPRAAHARPVDLLAPDAIMVDREGLTLIAEAEASAPGTEPDAATIAFTLAAAGRQTVCVPAAALARPPADPTSAPFPAAGHALATLPDSAFRRRWLDAFHRNPAEGTTLPAALDRGAAGRALVLDLQLPRPDVDAGSYAADQEIRLLQALGYKVTVLPLNLAHLGRYAEALQARGVEVLHAPFADSLEGALAARADTFDLVYMTRYNVARVALPLLRRWQRGARRVLNVADLHFLRELRAGLAAGSQEAVARARLTRETELALMREVDLTLTYSEVEEAVIHSHHLGRTKVGRVPWVASLPPSVAPLEGRRHLAFLGSFGHRPNVEAVRFFAGQVLPRLRARLPEIELHVYGSQMTDEVRALESPGLVVRGHAAEVGQVYDSHRIFVAPLLSGAGLKGKVIGAMAHGCPTVLSPFAAEGIGARPGREYVPAGEPDSWVEAIAALHADDAYWHAVAEAGRDHVQDAYGFARGVEALRRALESIDVVLPRRHGALCGR